MAQRPPTIPWPALLLGLMGLSPFFGSALLMLTDDPGLAALGLNAFSLYAAVILSFLGGVRWGLEIARAPDAPDPLRLGYSVLPSIAGWALALYALQAPGQHGVAAAFGGLFAAQYVWDRSSGREGLAPSWYPLLRQVLTGGVMIACLVLPLANAMGRI